MPNGGIDNCGTCWFNAKNKGDHGHEHASDPEPDFCTIRQLDISDAFHTYCANHPYVRLGYDRSPLGPVYKHNYSLDKREIWRSSPDTDAIRLHLLRVLQENIAPLELSDDYVYSIFAPRPGEELIHARRIDDQGTNILQVLETVIDQLIEFREYRARELIQRIVSMYETADGDIEPTYARILNLTREFLAVVPDVK